MQRKPAQTRWDPKGIEMVKWAPWVRSETDPEVDGEQYEVVRMSGRAVAEEARAADEKAPMRFHIKRSDLATRGFSKAGRGCNAVQMRHNQAITCGTMQGEAGRGNERRREGAHA